MGDVHKEKCLSKKKKKRKKKRVELGKIWICHYKPKDSPWEWKHIDFSVKKKFQIQQSVKKVIITVFWDRKGTITIDFHLKKKVQL